MKMNTIDSRVLDQVPVAEPSNNTTSHRILTFKFRWELHQVDRNTVEVHVPTGGSQPIINPRWIEMTHMTDAQVERHELSILRDCAILPE